MDETRASNIDKSDWDNAKSTLETTSGIYLSIHRREPRSVQQKAIEVEEILKQENLCPSQGDLLTEDEVSQLKRYVFEKDQWCLIASRKLTRNLMIQLHPRSQWADWYWAPDEMGKPRFIDSALSNNWKFNLAHTQDAVACIVQQKNEVGIDIENWTRPAHCIELAERFFSREEAHELQNYENDPTQLSRRFFAVWTLKEAFVKALGLGLRFPLDAFRVELPEDLPRPESQQYTGIQLHWTDNLPESYMRLDDQSWELRLWNCPPDLWMATCIQGGQSKNFDYKLVEVN